MNIDDFKEAIEELENKNKKKNLIDSLYNLIFITEQSFDNEISEKNFEKDCENFRNDFPDYPFPNCIYFKGQINET